MISIKEQIEDYPEWHKINSILWNQFKNDIWNPIWYQNILLPITDEIERYIDEIS